MLIYNKIKTSLINGRKRNIYTKKNSRKKYIKSKGRMINLKTYLKTVKKKRGGGKKQSIDKRTVKEQIIEKANAMEQRRLLKLVPFYMRSPTQSSPTQSSPTQSSPTQSSRLSRLSRLSRPSIPSRPNPKSRRSSSPLKPPTNFFQ